MKVFLPYNFRLDITVKYLSRSMSGGTHTTTGTEATEESVTESISHPLQSQSDYDLTDDDIDEIERKFADLEKFNATTSKS